MKRIAHASLAVLLLACSSAWAGPLLGAHYEISVTDHEATGTIKSQFRLKADDKQKMELLPNYIELSVHPVSSTEYDLHMVITPKNGPASSVRLDHIFRGKFGIPLELDIKADALAVTGAIAVGQL